MAMKRIRPEGIINPLSGGLRRTGLVFNNFDPVGGNLRGNQVLHGLGTIHLGLFSHTCS